MVNAAGAWGWQPYHLPVPLSWNLETLTSWNPLGHSALSALPFWLPTLPCSRAQSVRILSLVWETSVQNSVKKYSTVPTLRCLVANILRIWYNLIVFGNKNLFGVVLFWRVRKIAKKWQLTSSCWSVCPSARSSACNNSGPTGRIFMKFDIWICFENLPRKFKFNKLWEE